MMMKSRALTLSLTFSLLLAGCTTIDIRGHEVTPEQLQPIKIGVTTKQEVAKLLGTPSSVSTFGNQSWFYMYERTRRRAILKPEILRSNITCIGFDDQGRVASIDSLTEANKQVVSHVKRSTPTAGHEFSVVQQIFGNIGRFNGKDPDK